MWLRLGQIQWGSFTFLPLVTAGRCVQAPGRIPPSWQTWAMPLGRQNLKPPVRRTALDEVGGYHDLLRCGCAQPRIVVNVNCMVVHTTFPHTQLDSQNAVAYELRFTGWVRRRLRKYTVLYFYHTILPTDMLPIYMHTCKYLHACMQTSMHPCIRT